MERYRTPMVFGRMFLIMLVPSPENPMPPSLFRLILFPVIAHRYPSVRLIPNELPVILLSLMVMKLDLPPSRIPVCRLSLMMLSDMVVDGKLVKEPLFHMPTAQFSIMLW